MSEGRFEKFERFEKFMVLVVLAGLAPLAFAQQSEIAKWDPAMAQKNAVVDTNGVKWVDGKFLPIEGRAFSDVDHYYDRLPKNVTTNVNGGVRSMKHHTAGMQFRFTTDSKTLRFRWVPYSAGLSMDHMPSTGVSGIDVYRFEAAQGKWLYYKTGRIWDGVKGGSLDVSWTPGTPCLVNLPLYNGVKSFTLGIDKDATVAALPPRKSGVDKPVVFYGTSITHGGCCSRPGLAFPSIMGRDLDVPIVNLGFSGSGQGEFEMSEHVAAIDASCYVIDCVWNMNPSLMEQRYEKFVRNVRAKRPGVPIVLAEGCDVYCDTAQSDGIKARSKYVKPLYERLRKEGWTKLYFLPAKGQHADDFEGTVDGCHPNDWGMMHMAKAFGAVVRVALAAETAQAVATLEYAKAEAERLFARAGVPVSVMVTEDPPALAIAVAGGTAPAAPALAEVSFDGYACAAVAGSYAIVAREAKGVLNGLYALAERLGFAFVMPGEEGEYVPERLAVVEDGTWTESPRFKYRGLFSSSDCIRYTAKEWYAFLAKLRFNAMCAHVSGDGIRDDDFAKTVGLRLEIGGHGMSACLPRELFDKQPELFRMFQPEDFGGQRMKDSNFCATNPKTRDIVKENFKKKLAPGVKRGYHAIHGWADDLPGGGWCMCSRCRALLGTDQSQLTMNLEAQAVKELGADMRVPAIAYHDTMFPSETIAPDPVCFLLFAPRERCYAHALNDPNCALNRHYLKALAAWTARYKGIDDAHTFEYYNDKILFRGHTPYLPETIIGDGDAYQEAGIECWMSLQVGGQPLGPDWNMLAHAIVAWERGLSREALTRRIAGKVSAGKGGAWYEYLDRRASAYDSAWKVCDIPSSLYFDYRFMPERPSGQGGAELVAAQRLGAETLALANAGLEKAKAGMGRFAARIAELELKRSAFEAEDLAAMSVHQRGLNAIADYWNGAGSGAVAGALANLREAVVRLGRASDLFAICAKGYEKNQYYFGFVKNWTVPEIENKIRVYSDVAR